MRAVPGGKRRTPEHDSLLNRPVTTVRLPRSIVRIAACATNSGLFVNAFTIHGAMPALTASPVQTSSCGRLPMAAQCRW